jgi:lysophospholipase L1-like esterase
VGDSVKFNEAAARVMKKHSVPTLDLYTPSKKNMKGWMKEANVHYHAHGSQALAELVVKDILTRLKN